MSPTFLNGLTILLIYQLIGEVTSRLLHLPIPGPVVGMVFLFVTLLLRSALVETLDLAANALLSHLALLFVPAGVGVMVHFARLGDQWLPITAALVLSTLISLVATAGMMLLVKHLQARWSSKHG